MPHGTAARRVNTGTAARWALAVQSAWLTRGLLARLLWPLSVVFGGVSAVRRLIYRLGWRQATRLPVPVVVVGNLVAGGAGKTPTVMAIVQLLSSRAYSPGIVSRGYGRSADGSALIRRGDSASTCGDEPLLMHLRLCVPVCVGRDRVEAGRLLLRHHPEVDVLVSDDGLQHLALARDAQVLVFDERGAGNGWLLPAGPLRESLPESVPARSVVLYNAVAPTTPLPGALALPSLAGVVALDAWWRGEPATPAQLHALRGRPVLATAGLARPQRFFEMLSAAGLSVTTQPLPDHHNYTALPWPADTADVVVTEKDAVKLDPARMGSTRVWVATLDFVPDAAFETALLALLPPPGTRHGNTPA